MRLMNRRDFLITSSMLGGAATLTRIFPNSWLGTAHAGTTGFFESEFGINDALCKKVLDKALFKGGDFADLYFEIGETSLLEKEKGPSCEMFNLQSRNG